MVMDDIKGSLNGGTVISARRLQMWKDNKRCDSRSVMIQFEGSSLLIRVKLGFISFSVREYIPAPLRCFKCQRMGHTAKGKCAVRNTEVNMNMASGSRGQILKL